MVKTCASGAKVPQWQGFEPRSGQKLERHLKVLQSGDPDVIFTHHTRCKDFCTTHCTAPTPHCLTAACFSLLSSTLLLSISLTHQHVNPNKWGMVEATHKQGMLEIILQLNWCCWRIFSNAPFNHIVLIQKLGSFLSLDLFSTKTRKSHEQVKLPKLS